MPPLCYITLQKKKFLGTPQAPAGRTLYPFSGDTPDPGTSRACGARLGRWCGAGWRPVAANPHHTTYQKDLAGGTSLAPRH
ncbi:hypothetical protein KSD_31030 [Ktedonobacter sp. SOSP1-85]|nr:hypothetical protein KSD_31030 [Ktedonobacter sp. SOSP1-85]